MSFRSFLAALALTASPALADGQHRILDYNNAPLGTLVLQGDVNISGEGQFAWHLLDELDIQLYLPPEAVYILIDPNNPIITQRTVFEGGWTTTRPRGQSQWGNCPGRPIFDHTDEPRWSYGDVEINYFSIEHGQPRFELRLGVCDGPVQAWGYNEVSAPPAPVFEHPREDVSMESCGNNPDVIARALACSDVIANPFADPSSVSHAHWTRAYVRCSEAPIPDLMADFMAAARTDTARWQEYYQRVGGYDGPMDGQLNWALLEAISRFANARCR